MPEPPPILGLGPSRLAARACAECRLPPQRLAEADARWLWPEDEAVAARLRRLGQEVLGRWAVEAAAAAAAQAQVPEAYPDAIRHGKKKY